jgi:nickel transport protein
MRITGKLAIVASIVAGMGAASLAQAHGIWFAQRSNQLALIYGLGGDDLDVIKRQQKVKSVTAYDEQGKEVSTQLTPSGPLLVVNTDNQPAIVAGIMDNGLWSKTADGKWYNKGKEEVPNATISLHTFKYGVHLRRPLDGAMPVLPGQKLQIVPVGKRLPDQMGQPLTVRVLYDGKPAHGAEVQPDLLNDPDSEPLKTGADGTVTIKVRNQGLNVVVAKFDSPPSEPAKTNSDEHEATLSFMLQHLPE